MDAIKVAWAASIVEEGMKKVTDLSGNYSRRIFVTGTLVRQKLGPHTVASSGGPVCGVLRFVVEEVICACGAPGDPNIDGATPELWKVPEAVPADMPVAILEIKIRVLIFRRIYILADTYLPYFWSALRYCVQMAALPLVPTFVNPQGAVKRRGLVRPQQAGPHHPRNWVLSFRQTTWLTQKISPHCLHR